jgi:hypothetical protein
MKPIKAVIFIITFVFLGFACKSPDMSDTWSDDQKTEWMDNCKKFMNDRGLEEDRAKDFCDCMLEKTSRKYTPEEAAQITEEEERKLWQECDYQW